MSEPAPVSDAVPLVDLAGAELLMELHKTLKARGSAFRLAATRYSSP